MNLCLLNCSLGFLDLFNHNFHKTEHELVEIQVQTDNTGTQHAMQNYKSQLYGASIVYYLGLLMLSAFSFPGFTSEYEFNSDNSYAVIHVQVWHWDLLLMPHCCSSVGWGMLHKTTKKHGKFGKSKQLDRRRSVHVTTYQSTGAQHEQNSCWSTKQWRFYIKSLINIRKIREIFTM